MGRPRVIPEAVSIAMVADILDISRLTVRRMIRRGDIQAYRIGPKIIRVPRVEVARLRAVSIEAKREGVRPRWAAVQSSPGVHNQT